MAARVIVSIEDLHKVIVHSGRPYGQGNVMRFSPYISSHPLAGRRAQDMFTNQIEKSFTELRVTDSRIHCKLIRAAALRIHLLCENETVQLLWRLPFSRHSLKTCLLPTVLQQSKTLHAQNASEVEVIIDNIIMELPSIFNLVEYSALDRILGVLCILFLLNADLKAQDLAARWPFDPGGKITARLNCDALFCIRKIFWILVVMSTITKKFIGATIKMKSSWHSAYIYGI
ncbi:40S ribosomal protein SA-like [Papaver somniferum]|uniref:40S ribosomal protein SA-like n=1 Tax=Papaver somniferum TaxID=3469 RepID=UPI000E70350A|nr:40S ribosomal protein SA-like [Papaver somniferum]